MMTDKESIEDARHALNYFDNVAEFWWMYPPEIVIGALVAEIKELKEALNNDEALYGNSR